MGQEGIAEGREMTVPYTTKYVVSFGKGLTTEEYANVQFDGIWITCYPYDTSKPTTIYPAHAVNSIKKCAVAVEQQEIRRTWDELANE